MRLLKSAVFTTVIFSSAVSFAEDTYTQLKPADDADVQLVMMQPLMGNWDCSRQVLQKDGSWLKPQQISHWQWRYVLNGYAVQDYWYPKADDLTGPGMGTNLRIYDPTSKTWKMTWTFDTLARFQTFVAIFDGDTMVMNGEYPASPQRPAHKAKITFHNISEKYFDWKYESSKLDDGKNWLEVVRLHCKKVG